MSLTAWMIATACSIAVGCVTAASLALLDVIPGWAVLFFYVVPTLFFASWTLHELDAVFWRRAATPVRRGLRLSRLGPPSARLEAPPPPVPRRARPDVSVAAPVTVLAAAAGLWLRMMRALLRLRGAPAVRRSFNTVFGVAAVAIAALAAWRFSSSGWPLGHANVPLTAAAAAFFLSTFSLRALAWQRLFRRDERPRSLALATSIGTASVSAIALPSRVDDAVSILVLRRLSRRRVPSVGTLALSLFLLGLMDMAALTPFALFAAATAPGQVGVRVTMLAMTGICVGAGLLAAALPSLRRSERVVRHRLGHWLALHAPASQREAVWAWLLVAASWATRAAGLNLVIEALGLHTDFAAATAYVVAGAGAAALPIGPAGQATQAGVGAAILAGSGIDGSAAIALALAVQLLTVAAGAAVAGLGGLAYAAGLRVQRRPA